MRLFASVFVGLLVLGVSSAAVAQGAPPPPSAGKTAGPSLFAGGEVEQSGFATSLGARVGLFLPTRRIAPNEWTTQVAFLGSLGLRTPVFGGRVGTSSGIGTGSNTTERATVPLELGLRLTRLPGPLAGYFEVGSRILLRNSSTVSTYQGKTRTEAGWIDPTYGLLVGGGLRGARWELGLHGLLVVVRRVDDPDVAVALRAAYHFTQF